MRTFDITPDGKRIVFDRVDEDSDIVLIELDPEKIRFDDPGKRWKKAFAEP